MQFKQVGFAKVGRVLKKILSRITKEKIQNKNGDKTKWKNMNYVRIGMNRDIIESKMKQVL